MDKHATLTQPVSARDHAEGPAAAPMTLVEYGDYQCPYCGAAYPVVKRLQKTLGKKLRFVFRNFPLTQAHPYALIAAEAAEAAALQGKFWEMHDLLFQHQSALARKNLLAYAETLGLDSDRFSRELKKRVYEDRVREDFRRGVQNGVYKTPGLFLNGVRHDGAWDRDILLETLTG